MLLQIGSAMLAADNGSTHTILWIIAAVLVIAGIVTIVRGAVLWGIVLIAGSAIYYREVRALRRRGVDVRARFRELPID